MKSVEISLSQDCEFTILVDEENDKVIAQYILDHKIWEPIETKVVTKLLSSGRRVVDIGANIGYYTLLLSRIVGNEGEVISFEPEDLNFSILQKNIIENNLKNVVLENLAVSDDKGDAFLYLADSNKGDHRIAYTSNRKTQKVECVSLDDYLMGLKRDVHFIKSDTQGHELKILNGMKSVISDNIDHLCCLMEFSPGLLEHAEDDGVERFLDFFDQYQSEIYWMEKAGGGCNLVLFSKGDLKREARKMLKRKEPDYSSDILIFFSHNAREKYFGEAGLSPYRKFMGFGRRKYYLC